MPAAPTLLAGQAVYSPTGRLSSNSLLKRRYRILNQLGQGGMGAVYKATDTQLGNALRAIKEMSQSGLNSQQEIIEAADAFKREALMLAGLRHQNLPRIYDHFTDAGRWYLVMDYIEGETLEDRLGKANAGHLPVREVLDIGIQLCTVLGYLHNYQPPIIFRDLKPPNVMLTADGHVYLIDFGIARHFKPGQARDTSAFISAGYAAPEQYGKSQTTPQSDIYSLGATLHRLLSGSDPSQKPFFFALLPGQIIPAALGTLIMRMVEMDAGRRPANMADVKQELQRIATGQAVPMQPVISPPPQNPGVPVQSPPQPQVLPSPIMPAQVSSSPPLGMIFYTYSGHSDLVLSVAWSPDGTRVASASQDKTVHVWDAATGKNILTYRGHTNIVWHAAWSPDGRYIASAGDDQTVQVWDASNGNNIFTYRGHSSYIYGVTWSPDSTRIASACYDGTVQVWQATRGRRVFTYRGHSGWVWSVAWSPDGKSIASAGQDGTVQVWDADTGDEDLTITYEGHSQVVRAVRWSPDGKSIASASDDKTVQVWDADTLDEIFTYEDHAAEVYALAWSPDGMRIASGGKDKTVQVWDAETGRNVDIYRGNAEVWAIAWSPDGQRIAASLDGNTVRVLQAE